LPSSLKRVLSCALGFSPHPPVSVCGTEDHDIHARLFLEAEHQGFTPQASGITAAPYYRMRHPYTKGPECVNWPALAFSVLARFNCHSLRRNINLLAITYAFRPRLSTPAYPGKIDLTQETLGLRRTGFSPVLSLLISASALPIAPPYPYRSGFAAIGTLPYHSVLRRSLRLRLCA
jgi:hypothetical protein